MSSAGLHFSHQTKIHMESNYAKNTKQNNLFVYIYADTSIKVGSS